MAAVVTLAPGGSGAHIPRVRGRRQGMLIAQVALDNSYPTGGYDISAVFAEFKLEGSGNLGLAIFPASGVGGYVYAVDYTNKKLKVFRQTAATSALIEVANAVDLSAITRVDLLCWGVLN